MGAAGAKPLSYVLSVNKYLLILNLSGNFLGDQGVLSICDGLSNNQTLLSLNLSHNELTWEGARALASGLKCTTLLELILSRNPLKNKGAKAIAEMLAKGSEVGVEVLDIAECQITHKGALFIYGALKKAGAVRELRLDRNTLTAKHNPDLA